MEKFHEIVPFAGQGSIFFLLRNIRGREGRTGPPLLAGTNHQLRTQCFVDYIYVPCNFHLPWYGKITPPFWKGRTVLWNFSIHFENGIFLSRFNCSLRLTQKGGKRWMRKRYRNYESREGTNGDAAFFLPFFSFLFFSPLLSCADHTQNFLRRCHTIFFIATPWFRA